MKNHTYGVPLETATSRANDPVSRLLDLNDLLLNSKML